MKKISAEQFIAQVQHGVESDLLTAKYIVEVEKKANTYKEMLEDIQKIIETLNQPPFRVMFHSLIQSAVDSLTQKEAG